MSEATAIQPRQWRQRVAVGVSPRFGIYASPKAPTGATAICNNRCCRPCRGYGINLFPFRGLTPTAIGFRPSGAEPRPECLPAPTKQILAERDREAAQLDAFLKELGYE